MKTSEHNPIPNPNPIYHDFVTMFRRQGQIITPGEKQRNEEMPTTCCYICKGKRKECCWAPSASAKPSMETSKALDSVKATPSKNKQTYELIFYCPSHEPDPAASFLWDISNAYSRPYSTKGPISLISAPCSRKNLAISTFCSPAPSPISPLPFSRAPCCNSNAGISTKTNSTAAARTVLCSSMRFVFGFAQGLSIKGGFSLARSNILPNSKVPSSNNPLVSLFARNRQRGKEPRQMQVRRIQTCCRILGFFFDRS